MIRRSGFVVLVLALIVSACGHQVTPDRPGTNGSGLPPGYMSVKFRVVQPFNFQNYSYMVVLNTSGNGVTPRANGTQTAYAGYYFAILVTGTTGSATAQMFQYYRQPGYTVPQLLQIPATQQQIQFYPNTNGQGTEFTVIIDRTLFFGITPPTGATPPPPAPNWNFNFFVASGSLTSLIPVDSLGSGGPNDTTYSSPSLDMTTQFDTTITVMAGNHPSDQGPDNIQGGEIANNP